VRARRAAKRAALERRWIRRYYQSALPDDFVLPDHPTKRQFRVALKRPTGRLAFAKIDDRIRTGATLKRHLEHLAPHHVYFTTSTWLDPQRLGPRDFKKAGKSGYQVAHNVFLDQGLYFDIDVEGDLAKAAEHLLRLRDLLASSWGFQRFRAVYSGSKGFHLYVDDFSIRNFVEVEADPRKREAQHPIVKATFTNAAVNADIAVDAAVTLDPRRILRVPGTVHGKTLNLCEPVGLSRVESFVPRKIPSDGWRRLLG
jgi:DNA primase catalytic subunit